MTLNDNKAKHVLVVDDEQPIRDFLERALQHAGFSVSLAADGNAALAALNEKHFDLVLTDIVMPDLDGITLSLKIAKDYPDTKIMMMTGYSNQKERAYNLDFLVDEVVSKPFTLEEITTRVTKALAA